MKDKTSEEFFNEDGRRWFKTGDIGEVHPDGVLKIIGKIHLKILVKIVANVSVHNFFPQIARRIW